MTDGISRAGSLGRLPTEEASGKENKVNMPSGEKVSVSQLQPDSGPQITNFIGNTNSPPSPRPLTERQASTSDATANPPPGPSSPPSPLPGPSEQGRPLCSDGALKLLVTGDLQAALTVLSDLSRHEPHMVREICARFAELEPEMAAVVFEHFLHTGDELVLAQIGPPPAKASQDARPEPISHQSKLNALFDVFTAYFAPASLEETNRITDELIDEGGPVFVSLDFQMRDVSDRAKGARNQLNRPPDTASEPNINDPSSPENRDLGEALIYVMDGVEQELVRLHRMAEALIQKNFAHDDAAPSKGSMINIAQAILAAEVFQEHEDAEYLALMTACLCLDEVALAFEGREETLNEEDKTKSDEDRTLVNEILRSVFHDMRLPDELETLRNQLESHQPEYARAFQFPLSFMTADDWAAVTSRFVGALNDAADDADVEPIAERVVTDFLKEKLSSLTVESFPFIHAFTEANTAEQKRQAAILSVFANITQVLNLTYLTDDVREIALARIFARVENMVGRIFESRDRPTPGNDLNGDRDNDRNNSNANS
jgi:hypothetical protein